jgi:16S rRNA (cytidine1402-2'-O)-methyltransferase
MTTETRQGGVFLIPTVLHEGALQTIPSSVVEAVKQCQAFFVENERTARRFLKSVWKEMVIDDYTWFTIHKSEAPVKNEFIRLIREGKNIGIISEAGCPGIADPGQLLIAAAHEIGATVKPLVGPSSILLALMASGFNGQQFQFNGYLPIDVNERVKTLKQLEAESMKKKCTQLFIETPYRNNPLFETIIKVCMPATMLSIAADLTSGKEWIRTNKISDWKKSPPDLHKRPAIFSLLAQTN